MTLKTKALLYLAGIFAIGFLLGFVAGSRTHLYTDADSTLPIADYHRQAETVRKLTSELGLNAEQARRLEQIVGACHRRFIALRNDYKPRSDEIIDHTISEIRAILTPEQNRLYDQYLKKHRQRKN